MAKMWQLAKDEMKTYDENDERKTEVITFEKLIEAMEKLSSSQTGNTYRYLLKW